VKENGRKTKGHSGLEKKFTAKNGGMREKSEEKLKNTWGIGGKKEKICSRWKSSPFTLH